MKQNQIFTHKKSECTEISHGYVNARWSYFTYSNSGTVSISSMGFNIFRFYSIKSNDVMLMQIVK
jgi:hypothetical protein